MNENNFSDKKTPDDAVSTNNTPDSKVVENAVSTNDTPDTKAVENVAFVASEKVEIDANTVKEETIPTGFNVTEVKEVKEVSGSSTEYVSTDFNSVIPQARYEEVPKSAVNQPMKSASLALPIASMVLGILSVICCCALYLAIPCSIVGLVLGIISLVTNKAGRPFAIAGVVLSGVGIFLVIFLFFFMVIGGISYGSIFSNFTNFNSYL